MCITDVATYIIHIATLKGKVITPALYPQADNTSEYILNSLNYHHNPLTIIRLNHIANRFAQKTIICNFFFRIHILSLHRQKATDRAGMTLAYSRI